MTVDREGNRNDRAGVVIVNKNAGVHLAHVLESLQRQTVEPRRIVVVDNASDDGSLDGLEERFPSVQLVRSTENLGFAAANNLAVRLCDDCEFVALLNPDAFPEPQWLETLLAAAAAHPDCAAFGSRLVLAHDEGVLDGTGDNYHVSGLAWRRDQGAPADLERPEAETFSACAAAALYRRDVFLAVGGFDESFFCYYEDTDLAFRLRLAGHRCLYVPGAVARHVGSATTGLLSAFTIYYSSRNQVWTYVKNMPVRLFWIYLPQHLLVNLLTTLAYASRGQGPAAFRGKRDAVRDLGRIMDERRRIQRGRVATTNEVRDAMARGTAGYVLSFLSRVRGLRRQPRPGASDSGRLRHLDGLRGLAALFVVLHHTWLTVWPDLYDRRLPVVGSATRVLAFGHFAVVVFIVLSGFCLALPVARTGGLEGGARHFFRRRARRLLPPYYASLGLSLLLIWTLIGTRTGTHWDISVPVDWRGYVGNSLLLGNILGGGQINHVWWSVALEWQIYLTFPLLVACWLRFGAGLAAALGGVIAIAVAVVAAQYPVVGAFSLRNLMPWFVVLFSLGVLGAAIAETDTPAMRLLRERVRWQLLGSVLALGAVAACIAGGRQGALAHRTVLDLVVGAASICAIVTCSSHESRLRRLLSWRPLVLLGGFSYSLYLVHAPLLQVAWQYGLHPLGLGPSATFLLLALVGVPLVAGAAYVFFLAFERPFLRRRTSAAPRRAARRLESFSLGGRPLEPVVPSLSSLAD
jgi:GT2 family glycosyltransferase/peptidoglycan/LPS O-acetylase OafA/YrhL